MSSQVLFKNIYLAVLTSVLILTVMSLIFELLPEYEAKTFVIPTLISIIVLISFNIIRWSRGKF